MQNKGNYKQGEKAAFRMGESNSKWNNWPRINLQNIQAAQTAQYQKNKLPNQKVAKEVNRHFPKKIYRYTWKDTQHRLLLEKCKSKLQWRIISCWSEWPSSKCLQTINAGEGVEKRNSLTLLVGMQTGTTTMENSEKTGNRTAMWPSNPTAGHTHQRNQN